MQAYFFVFFVKKDDFLENPDILNPDLDFLLSNLLYFSYGSGSSQFESGSATGGAFNSCKDDKND